MILKFGTKLDSDKLYCVTKNSHILLISPFISSFVFLSNGNFRHRFLSSYWSQCFKFCIPLQVGKVDSLNENKDANPYFAFFFQFFIFPSVTLQ